MSYIPGLGLKNLLLITRDMDDSFAMGIELIDNILEWSFGMRSEAPKLSSNKSLDFSVLERVNRYKS